MQRLFIARQDRLVPVEVLLPIVQGVGVRGTAEMRILVCKML